jgi:hypothetical protein
LAEREEKKLAIQAALKAHSAKIPLKGAAAAAASAAQARSVTVRVHPSFFLPREYSTLITETQNYSQLDLHKLSQNGYFKP